MDTDFDEYFQDYEKNVLRLWNSYCSKAVGCTSSTTFIPLDCSQISIANRSFDYAKLFSESDEGLYILPAYDEENGKISELRQTLKAFLEGSWGMYEL